MQVRELRTNPVRYYTVLELLHQFDTSLVIRAGVHWSLFGGSLLNLGTARHEKYLDKVDSLEMVRSIAWIRRPCGRCLCTWLSFILPAWCSWDALADRDVQRAGCISRAAS